MNLENAKRLIIWDGGSIKYCKINHNRFVDVTFVSPIKITV